MTSRIGETLARLGGANLTILARAPMERQRFIQMALVLLTTAGLAVFSMSFALHDGVKTSWWAAVPLGICWGLIILNIDRLLVLSLSAVKGGWKLFWMALPRLLMAALLAVVISTPLVLRVFADEINAQIYTANLKKSNSDKKLEQTSKEQDELEAVRAQIATYEAVQGGILPATPDTAEVQTAKQAVVDATAVEQETAAKAKRAALEYDCERYAKSKLGSCDGTNASGVPGDGDRARQAKTNWQNAETTHTRAIKNLNDANAALDAASRRKKDLEQTELASKRTEADAELPKLKDREAELVAFLANRSSKGSAANDNNSGLLAQIGALSDAGERDSSLFWAHWLVFGLFFMIEILPVLVKIMLKLGSETAYDHFAQKAETTAVDDDQLRRDQEVVDFKKRVAKQATVTDDMQSREMQMGLRANAHVEQEMEKILDRALREWSDRVQSEFGGSPPTGNPPPSSGPPPAGPPPSGPTPTGGQGGPGQPVPPLPSQPGPPRRGLGVTPPAPGSAGPSGPTSQSAQQPWMTAQPAPNGHASTSGLPDGSTL